MIKIRKYKSADVTELLDLFRSTVLEINSRDYSPEQIEAWAPATAVDLKKWHKRFKSSKTIVAEINKQIVGFGNLENDNSSIGMLYVHKDFQGHGVGKKVLEKLEKKLIKRGINYSEVEASITARPFFESRDYVWVRNNNKELNEQLFLNFIMKKDLKGNKSSINVMPKEKSWKDIVLDKVFDLVIVIVGVTIAFQLNNWKLNADQRSLAQFYKESINRELDNDINDQQGILRELKADRGYVESYLATKEPSPDSLVATMLAALSLETFSPHQNTYQTLLQGNNLNVFGDREIPSRITEYYSSYTGIRRFEDVYTSALFRLHEYFSPYASYETQKLTDLDVINKNETRNLLIIVLGQLNDGIESHQEALEKAKALKKSLNLN